MYSSPISHQYDGDLSTQWGSVKRELTDEDGGESGDEFRDDGKRMKAGDYDLANCQEEDKKKQRRERNKMAAAKCRQRRVDLTNALLTETEKLEDEKNRLEEDIRALELQKAELQHILDSHSINCESKEEKPYSVNSMTSGFAFQGGHAMEVGPSLGQFKRSPTTGFVYPQQKQTNQFQNYNKVFNHTKGNLSTNQFSSPQFYTPGNNFVEDLSNPNHHGFAPIHAGHQRQPDHDFSRSYNQPYTPQDATMGGYADISCSKSNNQDIAENYHHNNNNNNYISPHHSSIFYKPCDTFPFQDSNSKPSCSQAYSSPHNSQNFKTDGDFFYNSSKSRTSPSFQETLESVLKVENQLNHQPMRHITSS